MLHQNYPTPAEVDNWQREMLDEADALTLTVKDVTESPVYTFPLAGCG